MRRTGSARVVGLNWWGVTPFDMARQSQEAGGKCSALALWNLEHPVDRRVMNAPAANHISNARVSLFTRSGAVDQTIVTTPHRLTKKSAARLRNTTDRLIALIGDKPTAARAVKPEVWQAFDVVGAPEASWMRDIPCARREVAPWGATLVGSQTRNASFSSPDCLVIVGAAYPERKVIARDLARLYPLIVQGPGWDDIPGARMLPAARRLATLDQLKRMNALVINLHHVQFESGLNPQFFDYAAAGIQQVVWRPDDKRGFHLALDEVDARFDAGALLTDPFVQSTNTDVHNIVRSNYMFSDIIERLVG